MYPKPTLTSGIALALTFAITSVAGVAGDLALSIMPPQLSPSDLTQATTDEPSGTMTLAQALALALLRNPLLSAYSQEIRAQEAAVLQSGLLPNPTLKANAANFANQRITGYDGDAVTLELSQLIELGGKRAARIETAALNQQIANWDYEAKRIEVLSQVTQAFIALLSAQQRLTLAEQTRELANRTLETIAARVQAGKVAPVEHTKAKIASTSVHIEWMHAQGDHQTARKQLAAYWASSEPRFSAVIGDLANTPAPPPLASLLQRLSANPELARWNTEITRRQALVNLEQSKAVPDLTATLGASKYLMPGDYALVAGFSLPLPVFDHNQGGIVEAEHRLNKAQDEQRAMELAVLTALHTAYQKLDGAYAEIHTLREEVLPAADSAYAAASEGYRLGKFAFIDVLDAQRTLFGAKQQYLSAQTAYHGSVIEVERLIGSGLQADFVNSAAEVVQ